jgi:hypothetical protein
MATDLAPEPTATAVTAPEALAPVPAPVVSFSDALDAALNAPTKTPEKVETKPEAVEPKAEDTKTEPETIYDRLAKIGLEETKVEPEVKASPEAKTETEDVKAPAAQTAFAKLTKELREAKTKLKEFESKVATRTDAVEEKGANPETDTQLKELQAKLEAFQTERDELEGELRLSKVEATREFKQTIGEPMREIVKSISELAAIYEIRPDKILDAANEPDSMKRRTLLKELTGEMDAVDALSIRKSAEDLVALNSKKAEIMKESKSALESIARRDQENEKASRTKYDTEAKKAFGEVWDSFTEEMPLLKKIDGNDQWNTTLDGLRTQAEKLDSEPLDHRQRAALTYQAVTLPLVVQVFKDYVSKTNKELASLKGNLADFRKATPGVGAGQAPTKVERGNPNMSFLDAMNQSV